MRPAGRIIWLAIRANLRNRGRFALLILLVTVGTCVFLGVQALSAASQSSLDAAITAESGEPGTYQLAISGAIPGSPTEIAATVQAGLKTLNATNLRMFQVFNTTIVDCPANDAQPTQVVLIRNEHGQPATPDAAFTPLPGNHCLSGISVPDDALYDPPADMKRAWPTSVFLAPQYEQLAGAALNAPSEYRFTLHTGDDQTDLSGRIQESMNTSIGTLAHQRGRDDISATVARLDSNSATRRASQGVRLVYGIIGWGVLLLGGLGILVAQLIVIRDRSWFFGLARSVGATRWHIALLVLLDVLLIVALGTLLALGLAALAQPFVAQFGRQQFQMDMVLLRPSAIPELVLGVILLLIVGGSYPATRATRLDPLEILESR